MDELITYQGVQKIYQSKSVKDFVFQIMDGNDHRYGRILWNTLSVVGWVPYAIWGGEGQVISTRLFMTICLISSYLLLSFAFIRSPLFIALSVLCMLVLPTTIYYSSMPKPEPLQLLFLSLSIFFISRRGFHSLLSWFFLGLALGAKVSTLPFVLYIGGLFLLTFFSVPYIKYSVNVIISCASSFFLGFALVVPILMAGGWERYLNSTLFNTGHGADQSDVNVFDWLYYTFFVTYSGNQIGFFILLLIFVLFCVDWWGVFLVVNDKLKFLRSPDSVILACSFLFLLPVILMVKRLWDFYLHIGLCFVLVYLFRRVSRASCIKHFAGASVLNYVKMVTIFGAILFIILGGGEAARELDLLSKRSQDDEYISRARVSLALDQIYLSRAERKGRPVRVIHDSKLFLPQESDKIDYRRLFGPLAEAHLVEVPDLIVIDMKSTKLRRELSSRLFPVFREKLRKEQALLTKLVTTNGGSFPRYHQVLLNTADDQWLLILEKSDGESK